MYTAVYNQSAQPFDLWSQKEAIEFAAKHWAHLNPVQSIYPASIPAVSPEWSVCVCVFLWPLVNHPVSTSTVFISISHTTRRFLSFFFFSCSFLPLFESCSPVLISPQSVSNHYFTSHHHISPHFPPPPPFLRPPIWNHPYQTRSPSQGTV